MEQGHAVSGPPGNDKTPVQDVRGGDPKRGRKGKWGDEEEGERRVYASGVRR